MEKRRETAKQKKKNYEQKNQYRIKEITRWKL